MTLEQARDLLLAKGFVARLLKSEHGEFLEGGLSASKTEGIPVVRESFAISPEERGWTCTFAGGTRDLERDFQDLAAAVEFAAMELGRRQFAPDRRVLTLSSGIDAQRSALFAAVVRLLFVRFQCETVRDVATGRSLEHFSKIPFDRVRELVIERRETGSIARIVREDHGLVVYFLAQSQNAIDDAATEVTEMARHGLPLPVGGVVISAERVAS